MNKQKFFVNVFSNFIILLIVGSVFLVTLQTNPIRLTSGQGYSAIYSGNPDKTNISLMINVYWGTEFIPDMLEILEENEVKATFFVGGSWANKNPQMLKAIYEAGHEIGNHGEKANHERDDHGHRRTHGRRLLPHRKKPVHLQIKGHLQRGEEHPQEYEKNDERLDQVLRLEGTLDVGVLAEIRAGRIEFLADDDVVAGGHHEGDLMLRVHRRDLHGPRGRSRLGEHQRLRPE